MNGLKYLTIKPTIYCAFDCPYCISRQSLFKESKNRELSLDNWLNVFRQADELGCSYLDISGGEPTMYKFLFPLIKGAKDLGWYVSINTAGIRISKMVDELVAAGLDKVCISLLSLDPEINNKLRTGKNISEQTYKGIEAIKNSPIDLALHFILSKHNYRELPDVVQFAFNQNAAQLAIAFPENDHVLHTLLMNEEQIEEFESIVLPKAIGVYEKLKKHNNSFPILFDKTLGSLNYSKGIYWNSLTEIVERCDKPHTFLLIYPNGDVMPCNGIEYTHKPILGNVNKDKLADIWENNIMEEFRKCRIQYCINCPIKRHTGIAIEKIKIPPYSAEVIKWK